MLTTQGHARPPRRAQLTKHRRGNGAGTGIALISPEGMALHSRRTLRCVEQVSRGREAAHARLPRADAMTTRSLHTPNSQAPPHLFLVVLPPHLAPDGLQALAQVSTPGTHFIFTSPVAQGSPHKRGMTGGPRLQHRPHLQSCGPAHRELGVNRAHKGRLVRVVCTIFTLRCRQAPAHGLQGLTHAIRRVLQGNRVASPLLPHPPLSTQGREPILRTLQQELPHSLQHSHQGLRAVHKRGHAGRNPKERQAPHLPEE